MKRINKIKSKNDAWTTPEVVDFGLFMKCDQFEKDQIMSYVIIPRYATTIECLFMSDGLNTASIIDLGKAVLS